MGKLIAALILVAIGCGGPVEPVPTASMAWTIEDTCADGSPSQFRLFNLTSGAETPAGGQVFATEGDTGSVDLAVACSPGDVVCFGATPRPANGRSWGRGLDGLTDCAACCAICGHVAVGGLACP